MDLVIGLPDICHHFKEVLFYMMNCPAVDEVDGLQLINPESIAGELSESWSKPVPLQSSEEEDLVPEPESFDNELVMGENLGVAIAQYKSEVSARVSPEMLHSTPVLQFLLDEGEGVFVPKAWTGINGIQPVKLDFIADAPTRLKPQSRSLLQYPKPPRQSFSVYGHIFIESHLPR